MNHQTCCICGKNYSVSHTGSRFCSLACRRAETVEQRLWSKIDKRGPDECWPWLGAKIRNYGVLHVNGRNQFATRVLWTLMHGPIERKQWVLHRCDNASCLNPAHHFLGDSKTNVADKMAKGRHRGARGERCKNHVLVSAQVQYVRTSFANGEMDLGELAAKYHVDRETIRFIVKNINWKHLAWPSEEVKSACLDRIYQRLAA